MGIIIIKFPLSVFLKNVMSVFEIYRVYASVFAVAVMIVLTSCGTSVKEVGYQKAYEIPDNAEPVPISLRKVRIDIPLGAEIGTVTSRSRFCGWPYESLSRGNIAGALRVEELRRVFSYTMESLGYDVTVDNEFIFDPEIEEEELRSEYLIGAKIRQVKARICINEPNILLSLVTGGSGVSGLIYMKVEWSVYDNLRKKTVLKTTSEGFVNRSDPNKDGFELLIHQAFEMALHNFGTQREVHNLLFRKSEEEVLESAERSFVPESLSGPADVKADKVSQGDLPDKTTKTENRSDNKEYRNALLFVDGKPVSKLPLENAKDRIRKSSVLIQAGAGHGSGFYISPDLIVSNFHVVGNAERVRVTTIDDNRESVIGHVIRFDKVRDVSLVKIKPGTMPDDHVHVAPVKPEWPEVGSTVYALGAPRMQKLSGTLTRGIVSAHRRGFKIEGRQNYIQADVAIHGGSSGGPLFDQYGNVVGIAVAGYDPTGFKINTGLNLFIPIGEALDKLGVRIKNRSP